MKLLIYFDLTIYIRVIDSLNLLNWIRMHFNDSHIEMCIVPYKQYESLSRKFGKS